MTTKTIEPQAALFDFDGVVMDTESQYSRIWSTIGRKYHPEIEDFAMCIKGQTLRQILDTHFGDDAVLQKTVVDELWDYERQMKYEYFPGVKEFIEALRAQHIHTALVTSSDNEKMKNVYAAHPRIVELFDTIITAEDFTHSKPHPECFLLGAERLGVRPERCVVFEDSTHGLKAGRAAGMRTVGVATTYPRETVAMLSDCVIDGFTDVSVAQFFEI